MSSNVLADTGKLPSGHIKDLRGKRFGTLTVEEFASINDNGWACWRCKCDCGNTIVKTSFQLNYTKTVSCGCVSTRPKRLNVKTHHMSRTRLHNIWKSMRSRCLCKDPKRREYWEYSQRGISVCDEWNDFMNFYEWAHENGYDENAPTGECTLDRIDVNGNYEPSNCRWVNLTKQVRNRRKTVFLTYNGEKRPLTEWCELLGLNKKTVYGRLHDYGWTDPHEILFGKGAKLCQQV